ncbi:hypothetical protein D9M72_454940 [compost metagenome]
MVAETEVHAAAEGEVAVGRAADIEGVGVLELLGVAVGRTVKQAELDAALGAPAADLDVLDAMAVEEGKRGFVPEHLLDTGLDQAGFVPQPRHLLGKAQERMHAAAEHVDRRAVARHEDQHAGGDEFVEVHCAGALSLDQHRDEIIFRRALALGLQRRQILVELGGVVFGDLLARVGTVDVEELHDVFRPDAELRTVFVRHAEQAADDMAGNVGGEVIDEIDLAAIGEAVNQAVDIGLDLVAQLGDHGRREQLEHLLAQPVVHGAVAVEQAELDEALVVRHVMPVGGALQFRKLLGGRNVLERAHHALVHDDRRDILEA